MDLIKLTDYAAEKGRDPEEVWTALQAVIASGQAPSGLVIDRKKKGAVRYVDRDVAKLVDLKNEESLTGRVKTLEVGFGRMHDVVEDHERRIDRLESRVA